MKFVAKQLFWLIIVLILLTSILVAFWPLFVAIVLIGLIVYLVRRNRSV
ncbi:hypothetical protein [Paucilactobacillus sp. N302-9]